MCATTIVLIKNWPNMKKCNATANTKSVAAALKILVSDTIQSLWMDKTGKLITNNFFIPKAIDRMVIHHANGLHKSIADCSANKLKASFF